MTPLVLPILLSSFIVKIFLVKTVTSLSNINDTDYFTMLPKIEIQSISLEAPWENDWEILQLQNEEIGIVAKYKNNLKLNLLCTAPYAIYWVYDDPDGNISDSEHARSDREIYLKLQFESPVPTMVRVKCEDIDEDNFKIINVFIPGTGTLLNAGQTIFYTRDSKTVECPAVNPKAPVTLFSVDLNVSGLQNNNEEVVNSFTYDPSVGFRLNSTLNGSYVCKGGNDTVKLVHLGSMLPKLEIRNFNSQTPWENDWEIVQLQNDEIGIVAKHTNNPKLRLQCTAPYEIIWQYNLYIDDEKSESEEDTKGSTSIIVLANEFKKLPVIERIKCKHRVEDYFTRITIFVPGKNGQKLLHSGDTIRYSDQNNWIKCPVTNPNTTVKLLSYDFNNNVRKVDYLLYDPAVGFKLKDKLNRFYECWVGSEFVKFIPPKFMIFVVKTKSIKDMCPTEDMALLLFKGTVLISEDPSHTNITSRERTSQNKILINLNISSFEGETRIKITKKYIANPLVEVFCVIEDKGVQSNGIYRGRVDMKWNINPLRSNRSLSINSTVQSHYVNSTDGTPFNIIKEEKSLLGTAIHITFDGLEKADPKTVVYTDQVSTFLCQSNSPKNNVTFMVELVNGTKLTLRQNDFGSVKIESSSGEYSQFVKWTLNIRLPIDAVAISCEIPFKQHSTFYLADIVHFQAKHAYGPEILKSSNITNPKMHVVLIGVTHFKLICYAMGDPSPYYQWNKYNENGTKVLNVHLREFTNKLSGEGVLEFPAIKKSHEGLYECSALNRLGSATSYFRIEVDENPEPKIYLYAVIIGFSCVAIGLLICGFGIHRYYKSVNASMKYHVPDGEKDAYDLIRTFVVTTWLGLKRLLRGLTEEELKEFFEGKPAGKEGRENMPFLGDFDALPYNNEYEIDLADTELDYQSILGAGEFALVIKGHVKSKRIDVAVKIAKSGTDVNTFKTMLSEVKILSHIGTHKNVIGLVGVNTQDVQSRNLYIFMNICECGSLEKYLRKNKEIFTNLINENNQIIILKNHASEAETHLSTCDLIRWASEIASGMEFLSKKSIIHADLAARNILLMKDLTVKISDFGLSKKLYEDRLYVKKTKCPLPWRWMALESLKTLTFSTESDVWSYGITVWEIFSLGDVPFPNETWDHDFIDKLTGGLRMGKPKFCPLEIYSKMVECWDNNPKNRPQFSELRQSFGNMYESLASTTNTDENQIGASTTAGIYLSNMDPLEHAMKINDPKSAVPCTGEMYKNDV